MSEQHDDHIWLTVGGEAWAIKRISGPLIQLWRGYEPELEYAVVDMSGFNADAYAAEATQLLARSRSDGPAPIASIHNHAPLKAVSAPLNANAPYRQALHRHRETTAVLPASQR
jgi:hypothetical protein